MKLLYDVELRRPGCALLQAAAGCGAIAMQFPSESWLLAPTPAMRVYEVDAEQLAVLVNRAHAAAEGLEAG